MCCGNVACPVGTPAALTSKWLNSKVRGIRYCSDVHTAGTRDGKEDGVGGSAKAEEEKEKGNGKE